MLIKGKKLSRAEMRTVMGNNVGDEIRKYRDEKCLTQTFMADALGIGQSAYYKIETGSNKVSIERLKQIAKILGKSVEVFLLEGNKDEIHDAEIGEPSTVVSIGLSEYELLQKTILQLEKRIEELEGKIARRDKKNEELKL